ncbi:hypothetical protein BHC46_01110 [Snodgrassella alvi]|jgi:hypothetical protein|uniref:DUF1828 domain-containing protein n=1 Tax=Snodgrassella alvi TaxID=1196083 RepID=A0A2N9XPN0_9NEIS|nr:DUF1828 domain-containing protein [Snodgrassella alvi]PIT50285.1 hypothetical protein BHC46_01110 [Snodgrassella alvi]
MLTTDIETLLCTNFCSAIKTRKRPDGSIQVVTPFVGRDGDTYNIYIKQEDDSLYRITDKGSTIMRLSYENDLKFLKGVRGQILNEIAEEYGAQFEGGEIFIKSIYSNIADAVFGIGQVLTRVSDLGLWSKNRVKSTFYEDLETNLSQVIPNTKNVQQNYFTIQDTEELYPIDYYIEPSSKSESALAIFGVPDSSKARLVTIVMSKIEEWKLNCSTIVVLNGLDNISNSDLKRLMDAVDNEFVPEVSDIGALKKKVAAGLRLN